MYLKTLKFYIYYLYCCDFLKIPKTYIIFKKVYSGKYAILWTFTPP